MEIKHTATAGTMESSDVMVVVEKSDDGIEMSISSPVLHQFGEQIKRVALETLAALKVENANIVIMDKGALDCTIRARIESAVFRAADASQENISWEVL